MDTKDQNLNFCELKEDNMEYTVGAAIIVTLIYTVKKAALINEIHRNGIHG